MSKIGPNGRVNVPVLQDVEDYDSEESEDGPTGAEGAFLGFFGIDVKTMPKAVKTWKNDPRQQEPDVESEVVEPEAAKGLETALDLGDATNNALSRLFALRGFLGDAEGREKKKKPKKGLLNQVNRRGIPDDMKTVEQSLLYEKIRPLFICMKASGMFFVRYRRSSGGSIIDKIKNVTFLQCYCLLMCTVLLGNFVRSLFAFTDINGFDTVLFFKIVTSIFFYESMSRALIAYWMSYNRDSSIQKLFLNIEKICYSDRIIPYELSLSKAMVGLLIMSLSASLANVAALAFGFFGPDSVREVYINYLVPRPEAGSSWELGFKIFLLLMTLINGSVAMLSLSYYTITCYVLYKEFEYLCRTLAMKIREDGELSDDLEKFRIQHQKRCQLVSEADGIMKYYIANTLLTNVPLLCLLLYTSVYSTTGYADRLISVWRMFYVLIQMFVVTGAATYINTQAHAPLEVLYHLSAQNTKIDEELQVSLSMFLNRLSSTSVGLTSLDMFTINKPTLLTVLGMIITYFFLLLQFGLPGGSPESCTDMISIDTCMAIVNNTCLGNG